MTETNHNEEKEALETALNHTAIYRGIQLCTVAITRVDDWVVHGDCTVTGPGYTTAVAPSHEVKALIDASMDPAPPIGPPPSPPADPPTDVPPPDGAPADPATPIEPEPPAPPAVPGPPSAQGEGTHTVLARFITSSGKVWQAQAKVGDDPKVRALPVPFQDGEGNIHPGVDLFAYADGGEIGVGGMENGYDFVNNKELRFWYDGNEVFVRSSNGKGTYDFWRGCRHQMIRYGAAQPTWSPETIDYSVLPHYMPGTPVFNDGKITYGFNALGFDSSANMGTAGDRATIGYLHAIEAAFAANPTAETYAAARRAGDNAGTRAAIYFYDRATGLPINHNTYPGVTLFGKAQGGENASNPIVPYGGSYDGDTLIPRTSTFSISACPYKANLAHLTGICIAVAAATMSARDRDHVGFWGNYVCIGENPGYYATQGVVLSRPQRYWAWGLRSLFVAAYLSPMPDYFLAETRTQIALMNALPKNDYGLTGTFVRSDSEAGYDSVAEWMENYVAAVLDVVARKMPEAMPYATYMGKLAVAQLTNPDGTPNRLGPFATTYLWQYRVHGAAEFLSIDEQFKVSMLGDGFVQAEVDSVTAPGATAEDVYNAIVACNTRKKDGWTGKYAGDYCDFMRNAFPGTYPSLMRARAVAAYNAGAPGATAALDYVNNVPTQITSDHDWRFNIAPRDA